MLIRLANEELVEYPDEVGALALADPSEGDVPDFSLVELNLTINGLLAMFYDEELTIEENIAWARTHYTRWGTPTAVNMEKARSLIEVYKESVAQADIGYGPLELVKELYGIQSKSDVYIIENMPDSPKKLLTFSDGDEESTRQPADNSTN
jgi:hypothetical protein